MTAPIAGIDPHQDQFTVGIIDYHGVEVDHACFPNHAVGYLDAIALLRRHSVEIVGVEGSASWGSHVSIAVVAAGFDAREVSPQRSAAQRRGRRQAKTDANDAIACGTCCAGRAHPRTGTGA